MAARKTPLDHGLWLTIIACLLYFAGRAPFAGQWDSFDYLKQIATHRLSDLGFGRPVFIAYNIALWETMRKVFGLGPHQLEAVAMAGTILLGGIGMWLFLCLARKLLPARAAQMAALGFLLSPLYAIYSGYVMTEVPMLAALLAAAVLLWSSDAGRLGGKDLAGGAFFGIAVGIREQAATLAGAFLWILLVRRGTLSSRRRSILRFSAAALATALAPALAIYFHDPASFARRIENWLRILPTGETHLWKNIQASLLYTFLLCPAAWSAALGAAVRRLNVWRRRRAEENSRSGDSACAPEQAGSRAATQSHAWRLETSSAKIFRGIALSLALPLAVLWRDADVQLHPRYLLVVLPASMILCASLYHRWAPSPRAFAVWTALHLLAFGATWVVVQPFRQLQREKKEFARIVRERVPGEALLLAGSYSPVFDYYRALGERPQWTILWSGWGWERNKEEAAILDAWKQGRPVYLCDGPAAWLYFEDQRLDLHFILLPKRKELVAPGLLRVYP